MMRIISLFCITKHTSEQKIENSVLQTVNTQFGDYF